MFKIFIYLLLLVAVFLIGLYIPRNSTVITSQSSTQEKIATNKFFNFVDTYESIKDMGTPDILFMKPDSDLIVFLYPTSQESASFGVYNYTTNEIFTGIGQTGHDLEARPIAIIGNDKLLMLSNPEFSSQGHLVIKNFQGETVGISTGIIDPAFGFFHEAYGFQDNDGKLFISFQTTSEFSPGVTKYKTYEFDEETFKLTAQ